MLKQKGLSMDQNMLLQSLYTLNEEEQFYKSYYYARQQEYSYQKFMSTLDMNYVETHHLILPEFPDTTPPIFEDYWIFDVDQPISALKHNCYTPEFVHDHTFFELTYVYSGQCTQNINEQIISLHTGDFLIMPPGVMHSIAVFDESIIIQIPVKKNTLTKVFFNFLSNDNILSMFFINNIYSKQVNDYIIFHSGDDYHIRTAIIMLLLENKNRYEYWQTMMINTLMNIFALLLRNYEKSVELPTIVKKTDIQRFGLIRYIQENYANVTLEMIAQKFHYTPEYTSKLIKDTTGMTFKKILQNIRMERACYLLWDTNLTIQNIGYQIGYENVEHFVRTFKKVIGMTPTEYRKSESNHHMI